MIFDPSTLRRNAFGKGMLDFLLNTSYDSSRPMGNVAASELQMVINGWLVGVHDEVAPVVPRCIDWLNRAIETDEKFGPNQDLHRATLHWAKGIADWMDTGWESGIWEGARVYEEAAWRYEKRPWPMNEIVRYGLDDYMAFAYQAGDDENPEGYENAIQMYEHWLDKTPPSLSKVLKPREFAYALCLQKVARRYDEDELFQAGRRMLRANLESHWFGAGQYVRGATWLKIVYWNRDRSLTPLETILKAYDDMPNVKRLDSAEP